MTRWCASGRASRSCPASPSPGRSAPDGLTYTFHLEKANFSDGKPVTSEDVKFTLIEVSSKYGAKFSTPGKAIKDIETPDPQTVIIHLSKPFGPFLFSLACEQNAAILPAHVFRDTDVLKNPATTDEAGRQRPLHAFRMGARRSSDFRAQSQLLARTGKPYLDSLVVKIMPDLSARDPGAPGGRDRLRR